MKNSTAIAALTLWTLLAPAGAQLVGQLGVLDPQNANGGINPKTGVAWEEGDTYRLAFYTEDKRDTLSNDIADYNVFVQSVATGSTTFPDLGDGTWKVLGSTATVSARQNTGTDDTSAGVGEPVFVLDGVTMIAQDNADMWNGFPLRYATDDPENPNVGAHPMYYCPYLNEDGVEIVEIIFGREIATGTTSSGNIAGDPLGDPNMDGLRLTVGASRANTTGRVWARFGNRNPSSSWSFYALSEPLIVTTGIAPPPFAITDIDYTPDADPAPTVTLTWRKTGAASYIARISRNLSNWDEDLDDSIAPERDENLGDSDHITVTFPLNNGLENETNLFFRIEEPPTPQ